MLGELPRATDYYFSLALAFSLNSYEIIRMGSFYSNQTRVYFIRAVYYRSQIDAKSGWWNGLIDVTRDVFKRFSRNMDTDWKILISPYSMVK